MSTSSSPPAPRPGRPRRQHRPARRRHALCREVRRRRHAGLAAAGPWRRAADRGQRLREPGRRADRGPPRRRPARRHQDGPARGHRAQRRQRQGLCHADQQHQAQGRPGRRRQPARRQRLRPHHRDHARPAATSPRESGTGRSCSSAATRRRRGRRHLLHRHHRQRLVRHARQLRHRRAGRLWVSTDGNTPRPPAAPTASGRSIPKAPPAAPRSSSSGCRSAPRCAARCFTPDDETFFVAVQHPGEGGDEWDGFGRPSYYEDLSTRWPDFDAAMPARPSVVAITRQGGGRIG